MRELHDAEEEGDNMEVTEFRYGAVTVMYHGTHPVVGIAFCASPVWTLARVSMN